jgi:hypothetical protein
MSARLKANEVASMSRMAGRGGAGFASKQGVAFATSSPLLRLARGAGALAQGVEAVSVLKH